MKLFDFLLSNPLDFWSFLMISASFALLCWHRNKQKHRCETKMSAFSVSPNDLSIFINQCCQLFGHDLLDDHCLLFLFSPNVEIVLFLPRRGAGTFLIHLLRREKPSKKGQKMSKPHSAPPGWNAVCSSAGQKRWAIWKHFEDFDVLIWKISYVNICNYSYKHQIKYVKLNCCLNSKHPNWNCQMTN